MSDPAENIETRVSSLFKGNQFLAFVYQRYTDVRWWVHHRKVSVSLEVIQITGNGRAIQAIFPFSGCIYAQMANLLNMLRIIYR